MRVGIWEQDEGVAAAVSAALAERGAAVRTGRHPAELAPWPLELLAVAPGARGWAGAGTRHTAACSRLPIRAGGAETALMPGCRT